MQTGSVNDFSQPCRARADAEAPEDGYAANKPKFLTDDRENKVRVRSGKKNSFCLLAPGPTP